jgi:hypothetical protein
MALAISADALEVIASGARYDTQATITIPGEDAVALEVSPGWSVSGKGPVAGPRLGISGLEILPGTYGGNLFELVGYPRARFNLKIGVGPGRLTEWFDVFTGYVQEGSSRRSNLGVSVSLVDGWGFVDRVPLESFTTTVGTTRATAITELITDAIADVDTNIGANGGYITTAGVYTDSRTSTAAKIAADGLLQTGFNGAGELIIKAQPDISGNATPLWRFRSEPSSLAFDPAPNAGPATIAAESMERTRPWLASLYNAVTVKPGGVDQTWAPQTVRLSKTCDPRHEDNVGFLPFEFTSDTVASACEAWNLAAAILTRLLRLSDERVKLDVLLNPAIECDDPFWVAASPTFDDPGWSGTYIATSVTHSPSAGITSIEGVTAGGFTLA